MEAGQITEPLRTPPEAPPVAEAPKPAKARPKFTVLQRFETGTGHGWKLLGDFEATNRKAAIAEATQEDGAFLVATAAELTEHTRKRETVVKDTFA